MDMEVLTAKIKTLFAYRDFDHLYELGELSAIKKDRLEANLIRLQQDIYFLDEYLESNWVLDDSELKLYWNHIHQSLSNLGVPSSEYDQYSSHIYNYQRHEIQLRSKKDLLRLSMEYFYFYKSCDVKLLRRLIYNHAPKIGRYYSLADWRCFDLITEVNDDVEDLVEDMQTINGNRLQLAINKYGVETAKTQFREFMDQILQQSITRVNLNKSKYYDSIHAKVVEQVEATIVLLNKSVAEYLSIINKEPQVS